MEQPFDPAGQVAAAVAAVRPLLPDGFAPRVALTLGSGLRDVADRMEVAAAIAFADIPGLGTTAVEGHAGRLLAGRWAGVAVLLWQGRLHHYEGHSWPAVTLPVRLSHALGCEIAVMTNASGGVRADLPAGALVAIRDHINLTGANPLVGVLPPSPGRRFFDMTDAYDPDLRRLLHETAAAQGVALAEGVYLAVTGPNFETPAEVVAFRSLGADVVGMSTVGEVIVARQLGLRCVGVSCVANPAAGVVAGAIDHQDVLAVGAAAAARLAPLLEGFLARL